MDRREKFLEEKKAIEAEEAKKNTSFQFEKIDYAPIQKDEISVFRFIGNPVHARSENFDPKMVFSSKIKDDKGNMFTVRWSEDSEWILNKIYTTVLSYKWDKTALRDDGKQGKRIYKYVDSYPKMVDRVLHNNEEAKAWVDGGKTKMIENSGWRPSSSIYFNVIDRADYQWHKENKSFKLIAKKVSYGENSKGEKVAYYEAGIPNSLYKLLLDTVVEEKGDWQDFDIAIKKIKDDPYYKMYSVNDERKISDEKHAPMSNEPLTEEELSWKKFDIDKITPITHYKTIQNRLGTFIKEVDKNLETSFSSELEELVSKEKAELDAKKLADVNLKDSPDDDMTEELVEKTEEAVEENVELPSEKKSRSKESVSNDFWSNPELASWKKLDLLKSKYSQFVADIKDGNVIYKDNDGEILGHNDPDVIECTDCHCDTYVNIPFCPKCGAEFTD
jgi:hypothetical protein